MGNDVSSCNSPYLERQMSNASGKDIETLKGFYNDFRNECPSGNLSPQKFTELCNKVFGSQQAEELQSKAFSRFDKHNNGTVLQGLPDGGSSNLQWISRGQIE